ncbi:E3 ubiquitin-protein transferase RMND5A isoform X1 [Panthera onca]|uniref:E3 ubiquitin-protein transferase RMND5A isoform X1 n=2 Tax=Panthera leo TaxID=9689 RepID=UPI001C6A254D|nr:E3 ubiquitin-protein transferase RMND5A isoform X1 [Panthera leo]XP_042788876.1 E3 ubiquitin-protein transferase RMND5A isoform X1 [Panthera leo]XP_042788877.1 E3 ubiquitin-protein transferase RMND5A isoform X1 [Panthera leo]XP_042837849.1 E3 ubiquitin-protein transferase RMND5A isoform X1 [Panthera tigris]XP_042837850.1 E3 ubiquitin-protein transferase RMND5A isoform X1 [Panthera tigris]XP_042837855.1 E3 ubiquitin-protein transferase RMND5A isoform X1 [Panthera tigris]XP_044910464.1 E3 ub
MDQCVTVERELEKVLHKFSGYGQLCERGLEELIDYTGGLKHEILQSHGQDAELSGTLSLVLTQCCKRIKDTVQKLASDHKDIHSSVSRVGKAIDKPLLGFCAMLLISCSHANEFGHLATEAGTDPSTDATLWRLEVQDQDAGRNFDSDISSVGIDGCWQADSQRLLNEVMVEHFFRQGMLDVAEELCQESGLSVDPSQKEPFVELNRILEALKVRVLRPALEWAVSNREMLIAQNSSLEFKLHRLYFISLLMGGTTNQREALQYAKNFQPFALNHQKDIQVLMGSLVYLRQGIENSPYVHLLDANQWADICDIFTRDACALLGLSVESPLSVSFSAGCVALPALINIKAVIEQRQCTGVWNQKDELPIEVDLGKKCWYHSIFACPILRQQTTDNNPPMKLVCGHIISRDALNKMFNGSKLKCPYCPMEQSPGDAKQIFF